MPRSSISRHMRHLDPSSTTSCSLMNVVILSCESLLLPDVLVSPLGFNFLRDPDSVSDRRAKRSSEVREFTVSIPGSRPAILLRVFAWGEIIYKCFRCSHRRISCEFYHFTSAFVVSSTFSLTFSALKNNVTVK